MQLFVYNRMIDILHTVLKVAMLLVCVGAINQNCPCPANANCLSNSMCACNSGFIGNCSTAATPLGATNITATVAPGSVSLFDINPINLNDYIQFTLSICTAGQASLTFYLWGQTGDTSSYNSGNSLGNPQTVTITGCQQLISPYIAFGTQPNGLNDQLILGIQNNGNQPAVLTLNVAQQTVIGVFLYYYILFGLVGLVALVIVIGVGIFIYRQRNRRRLAGVSSQGSTQPAYNNIEHFQTYMPMFQADRLGSQRSICPICLQQIQAAEVVRRPPCKHAFHTTCIDSWGLKNLSCPVCRADLSKVALQTAQRISIVQVNLPPEEDWQQQEPYVSATDAVTVEANYDPSPKKPILDDKYSIRQNML